MKNETFKRIIKHLESDTFIAGELLTEIEDKIEALLYFYISPPPLLLSCNKETVTPQRIKKLEMVYILFDVHLHESSVLFLAKIYEDFKVHSKQRLKHRVDIHDGEGFPEPDCGVKTIRALANVIKHNGSHLKKGSSKSADFIIEYWGMPSGYNLESIIIGNSPYRKMLDIPSQTFRLYKGIIKILSERIESPLPCKWNNETDMIEKIKNTLEI